MSTCVVALQTRWGPVDPSAWNQADGFSTIAPILFGLPATPAIDNLVPYTNISASTMPGATTVLLNAATGERIAHWTERDAFDQSYGRDRPPLLVLQPAVALAAGTRYIVAVTGLVEDTASRTVISAWPAFAALRDAVPDSRVPVSRVEYFNANVFPALTSAGVARSSLQLAWDFTTRSQAATVNRALSVRDDALSRVQASPPEIKVDHVDDFDCSVAGQNVGKYVWCVSFQCTATACCVCVLVHAVAPHTAATDLLFHGHVFVCLCQKACTLVCFCVCLRACLRPCELASLRVCLYACMRSCAC
jgi:hypothetical protein